MQKNRQKTNANVVNPEADAAKSLDPVIVYVSFIKYANNNQYSKSGQQRL